MDNYPYYTDEECTACRCQLEKKFFAFGDVQNGYVLYCCKNDSCKTHAVLWAKNYMILDEKEIKIFKLLYQ